MHSLKTKVSEWYWIKSDIMTKPGLSTDKPGFDIG